MSNPFLPAKCHVCEKVFTPLPRESVEARELPPGEYAAAVNSYVAVSKHIGECHPEICHVCPRSGEALNPNGFGTYWRPDDNTCSYCGSMHPEDFMKALWARKELTPTDKSYKVYVHDKRAGQKFYFQHLSIPQRQQMIDLMNLGRLNLAYPGYFYTPPFFVRFT